MERKVLRHICIMETMGCIVGNVRPTGLDRSSVTNTEHICIRSKQKEIDETTNEILYNQTNSWPVELNTTNVF